MSAPSMTFARGDSSVVDSARASPLGGEFALVGGTCAGWQPAKETQAKAANAIARRLVFIFRMSQGPVVIRRGGNGVGFGVGANGRRPPLRGGARPPARRR